jgi:DNA-binding GntR family transcriptional regulator
VKTLGEATGLVSRAASALREAISLGELAPGSLYSVNQVATELGISRTPVREAILGLADVGLVQIERNRGFRVVVPDHKHVKDILELRLLLEVPAARLAVLAGSELLTRQLAAEFDAMLLAARDNDEVGFMRHDRGFHAAILQGTGNQLLVSVVAGLRDGILSLGASTAGRSRSLRDIAVEHLPLLDAVRAGDPAAAEAALRDHLEHTRDLLLSQSVARFTTA